MDMTVTCLIPAWNESARIAAVLDAVTAHPLVTEVIVIDDGSQDGTAVVAAQSGARVLVQSANRGKSAAIAAGLAMASGDLILMLDADLTGLRAHHVTALLTPVLSGRADATLSLRDNAPLLWRIIGLDYISGERVFARAMLATHRDRIAGLRRFGLEVFLNDLWITAGVRLGVVPLTGVASPAKTRKHGLWRGLAGDISMMADIFRTFTPLRLLAQISRLHRLRAPVTKLSWIVRRGVTRVR